jgi:DNA-binding NarL/FixJ family response regulator
MATYSSSKDHGTLPAGRTRRAARWIIYAAPQSSSPDCLSPRELDVLALVAVGRTDVEIAERLSISPRTVGAHVSNMLNKTCVSNRVELVIWSISNGVLGLVPQP